MSATKKNVLLLFPKFEDGFVMGKVPLGLAYIASNLEKHGHYVEGYNLVVDPIELIDFDKFDYCGITVLTAFISHTRQLVDYVKKQNPKIKVVLGGPHPSMKILHSLKDITRNVDFVIAGEGEVAMVNLVEAENPHTGKLPGVYFLDETDNVVGAPNQQVGTLDDLPYPNQRIFDHGNLEPLNPFRSFLASRGCPFGCFNCQPYLKNVFKFRLRSPENIVTEMKHLQDTYGQEYFGMVDSEFPVNKKWFMDFVKLKDESKIKFNFHCNAFSKLLDEEILKTYKDMNITRLAIGVESGNQHVVDDVLNKRIDLEYTKKVFDMAQNLGITTHSYFMVGIPGESMENMQETLDYARNLNTNSLEFNIMTPWPGTRFYDMCEQKGWLENKYTFEDYNEKRLGVISTDQWKHTQVVEFHKHVTKTFIEDGWTPASDGTVFFKPGEKVPDAQTIAQIKQQFHVDG